MGIAITKTHTKFEDLIFKIGKVPAILRFDQFYKGNCLKATYKRLHIVVDIDLDVNLVLSMMLFYFDLHEKFVSPGHIN